MIDDTLQLSLALSPILGPLCGAILVLLLYRFRWRGAFFLSIALWAGVAWAVWTCEQHWPPQFVTTGFPDTNALLQSFATQFHLSLESLKFLKLLALAGMFLSALAQYHGQGRGATELDLAAIFLCVSGVSILTLGASLGAIVLGVLTFGAAVPIAAALRTSSWSSSVLRYLLGFSLGFVILLFGVLLVQLSVSSMDLALIYEVTRGSSVGALGLTLCFLGAAIALGWAPFNVLFVSLFSTSPHGVTTYLDILGKIALVGLASNLYPLLETVEWNGVSLIPFLGAVAMLWGALGAVGETRLARLLYFTGLVHCGFLMLVGTPSEFPFGIAMYFFTHLGLYGLACFLEQNHAMPDIHLLSGMGLQSPYLGAAVGVLLLSLASLPPSGIYLVRWTGGWTHPTGLLALVPWLAVIFASMRILFLMYARSPEGELKYEDSRFGYHLIIGIAMVCVLWGTIVPSWFGGLPTG